MSTTTIFDAARNMTKASIMMRTASLAPYRLLTTLRTCPPGHIVYALASVGIAPGARLAVDKMSKDVSGSRHSAAEHLIDLPTLIAEIFYHVAHSKIKLQREVMPRDHADVGAQRDCRLGAGIAMIRQALSALGCPTAAVAGATFRRCLRGGAATVDGLLELLICRARLHFTTSVA